MKVAVIPTSQGLGNTFVSSNLAAISSWTYLDLNAPAYGFDKLNSNEEKEAPLSWHFKTTLSSCGECDKCLSLCVKKCFTKSEEASTLTCKGCAEGECPVLCENNAIESQTQQVGSLYRSKKDNFTIARINYLQYRECEAVECALKALTEENVIVDCDEFEKNHTLIALKNCDYCLIVTEGSSFDFEVFKTIIRTCKLMGKPFGVIINKLTTPYDKLIDYCNLHSTDILAKIAYNKRDEKAILAGELLAKQKYTYKQHFNNAMSVIKKKLKKSQ